jgi:UDP-N-acetylglucosamine transferase subunit ALG13
MSGTFVTVGNATQPFDRLLDGVKQVLSELPSPVVVQHGSTAFHAPGCVAARQLGMEEFAELIQTSELLIMHAGAGSIIHAIQAERCPIVMPRRADRGEVVDNHQIEFAEDMAARELVIMVHDPSGLLAAVREARGAAPRRIGNACPSELVRVIGALLPRYAGLGEKDA